jgi:excisionase family DNA binding protein
MAATLHIESEHAEATHTAPRLGRSVSIDQAAELLQVSRRTIYNRIRDGRLATIRTIGGSQRVLVESLNELGASSHVLSTASVPSFAVRVAGN